ncbi:hypothetical protein GIB67_027813 [Kingdonia uniflora]|uniref:Membrane-associated kinase regulator 2 n=1 Tax=Kingdonia uniflora TaxID=39325 RepID=A0A7J7MIC7_9MAGN|nr:hypothetical protein GIB67_027813 [Kingdonia uniflora]
MEAFSLLKYWRSTANGNGACKDANIRTTNTTTTLRQVAETEDEERVDEGPFFDLEFTVPHEEQRSSNNGGDDEEEEEESESEGDEREFNFRVSSCSTGDHTDPNLSLSPSDDLFFKGSFDPLELTEPTQFKPISTTTATMEKTKFGVFSLGFKKPKGIISTEKVVENNNNGGVSTKAGTPSNSKSFTVKFKVEEVPIVSLFVRDSSSRKSSNKINNNNKEIPQSVEEIAASEEKKFQVQKYLKMIKPLYVKVSKRYGEKLGFSGQLSLASSAKTETPTLINPKTQTPISSKTHGGGGGGESDGATTTTTTTELVVNNVASNVVKGQKMGSSTGLRVFGMHLGKSRSGSAAVAAINPSKRRDDSLIQQQDGIHGAILHCKRSFNSSRDSDSSSSTLSRSTSESSHEKSKLSNDGIRTSFEDRKEGRL